MNASAATAKGMMTLATVTAATTMLQANSTGDGMDEDGEGPKIKYRKIKYLLLHFMPSLPLTLPSLCPYSHASCLLRLAVALPLVLRLLADERGKNKSCTVYS